ncbi:oncoprotein-induced transcript 3 protein isoform X2 [Nematostella vectensis]|nr:oncoprotein-induced transcript 3 protein isoform X2 [Nematostella vectensis]
MYDSQYYRCLDYSASEDWSEIGNNFTHTFPDQYWWARNWEISFASCCWIHLHGSTYSSSPWILYANVSLSTRPDTGRINQSPFSSIPLSINVTSRTRELIEIPVSDPDGDNVTCRWATDPPSFPFGELNERNCSLTYNGNGPAGNSYPVLLVLEDGLCNTSLQFVIDLIEYQPYECMYHKQLSTWDRSRYYSKTLGNCDQYSINWNSWYRFTGYAGTGMANSCVPGYHCGASASVWMNGSHPSVQEGAVGRTVHISYFGYCYRYNYHLTVRNCSGFYVYKFQYFDNYNCFRLCGNGINSPCSSSPCQNGGICHDQPNGFNCTCASGYTGNRCESQSNETHVKCSDGRMEIWLGKAKHPGVTASSLQLLDASCKGQDAGPYIYFSTGFGECGTEHNQTMDHITYWNKVYSPLTPIGISSNSSITRYSPPSLAFYCKYSRHGDVSLSYTIRKAVPVWHGSYGNFTFTMDLFYSGRYQRAHGLADYPVPVMIDEPLHIQYSVKSTTGNLSVLADSCRATLTKEAYSWPYYTLIERGCARDNTMSYVYKQNSTQRFTINSFRFVHQHPDQVVYLHCRLIVCHRLSYDSRCQQGCYGRRRREVNAEDEEAEDLYLTLKASNRQGGEGNQKVSSTSTATRAGLSTLGGLVVVLLAVIGVFGMCRRIAKKKPTMQLDVVASATNQVFTLDDESVQGHAQSTA